MNRLDCPACSRMTRDGFDTLSPSVLRILFHLLRWEATHQYPPTVRDLCRLESTGSTHYVGECLESLRAAGLVTWKPKQNRTIRLACKVEIFREAAESGATN